MNTDAKLREVVENVVARYIIGFAFEGIQKSHEFQATANPKKMVDALVKEIGQNLSYKTVVPQFDVMKPEQERLAIEFCAEIAGPLGKPGRNPDPVRLLEMAEALYKAEIDG